MYFCPLECEVSKWNFGSPKKRPIQSLWQSYSKNEHNQRKLRRFMWKNDDYACFFDKKRKLSQW